MDQYLIGSKSRLELDVTVKNAGEDAFEAMFYLYMPLGINYVNINKKKLVSHEIFFDTFSLSLSLLTSIPVFVIYFSNSILTASHYTG